MSKTQEYDIVIVGGGLVGATLALSLQSARGYRIALIESVALAQTDSPSYDDRSIALSYGSSRILQWLDLWQEISRRAEPILGIHVSERGRFGSTCISAEQERVPALGYVLASRSLGDVLIPRLLQCDSRYLSVYSPAQLIDLECSTDSVKVLLQSDREPLALNTRLLIAADGANSTVRKLLNVGASTIDYGQQAIIANISTQCPHNNIAYERFTDSGPLAFLPLQPYLNEHNRCAVVWTLEADKAEAIAALEDALFLHQLQQRFGQRLGRLLRTGARSRYPLALTNCDLRINGRTVFIGNAAQSLHPVAGQGFNLALRDTSILLECLLDSVGHGDPGNERLLQTYRQKRQQDQQRVIRFTDGLVRLFSNRLEPLAQARAFGLFALDLVPGLRRRLVQQGMGINMPLPRVGHYRQ